MERGAFGGARAPAGLHAKARRAGGPDGGARRAWLGQGLPPRARAFWVILPPCRNPAAHATASSLITYIYLRTIHYFIRLNSTRSFLILLLSSHLALAFSLASRFLAAITQLAITSALAYRL
jgi:hypothetical protein